VSTVELYCRPCARMRRFERPPCPDGHGPDCDEWACVACGDALLIASLTVHLDRHRPTTRRRRRPTVRQAA